VDVSSGVEASKGVKSSEKIAAFVEAVNGERFNGSRV
jgi:phosphoribosylanthranilate isomerase